MKNAQVNLSGVCTNKVCAKRIGSLLDNLGGKYLSMGQPGPDQKVAAWLDFSRWDSFEAYQKEVKKTHKGSALRHAKKAKNFRVRQFHRPLHVPDIADINTSKEVRSGGKMKPSYLRTVEELGGAPTLDTLEESKVHVRPCPAHRDEWWGIFELDCHHRQGEVPVGERLLGYICLKITGNFAFYSMILGHGDYLNKGIMYRLHLRLVQEKMEDGDLAGIMYAAWVSGGEGLQQWKRKVLFEPAFIVA